MKTLSTILTSLLLLISLHVAMAEDKIPRDEVISTMRKAAQYFRDNVASHGGYVYTYTLDLSKRWGEGEAEKDEIWVEPPGTPTVGMAYLKAYQATGDKLFLDAARETGEALLYGQLKSGGWTHSINFNPKGKRLAQYRNGKGGGKNYSTFDDNKTQASVKFLCQLDRALDFKDQKLHDATILALDSVLKAQFPNGAYPQGWQAPVKKQPVVKASYPDYDWQTEHRHKNYWDYYTLNDNLAGDMVKALTAAHRVYGDDRYLQAVRKLGDFLILAQMPEPQPAWAQQYSYEMKPMWARKFEPPAITSSESEDVISALIDIYSYTGHKKYLKPIPRAMAYFKASLLPDGRMPRFYELETNKPLYMFRKGKVYTLTYDDSNLPKHYSFKVKSKLDKLQKKYDKALEQKQFPLPLKQHTVSAKEAKQIIADLDAEGRWLSTSDGKRLKGQLKLDPKTTYISSRVFSQNLNALSDYLLSKGK